MRILCFADVGVDHYVNLKRKYIGGCGFNVYQSLKNVQKSLFCPIGNDADSLKIEKILSVDQNIILPTIRGKCSCQQIGLYEDGEKNFIHFDEGVWGHMRASKKDLDYINSYDLVHTVLYSQNVNAVDSFILKSNTQWAVDFMTMKDFDYEINFVKKYLPKLKYAFFGLNAQNVEFIVKLIELFRGSEIELIITLGDKGSRVYFKGQEFTQESLVVDTIVDTTGAGDAYIGTYLSCREKNKTIAESMKEANQVSSMIIQKISHGEQFRLE